MRKGIFLVFLLVVAIQDLHRKKVKVWVFVVFGILALGLNGYLWIVQKEDSMWNHVLSASLGAGLLALGRFCEGNIGTGDGWFFAVSGLMLEFWENLSLLCMGVMLCGSYGLAVLVWNQIRTGERAGNKTVPFLPFVAVPGILMAMEQGLGR